MSTWSGLRKANAPDQGSPLGLTLPPLPLLDTLGGVLSGLPQLLGKIPGSLGGLLGLHLPGSGDGPASLPASGGGAPENGKGKGPLDGLLHIVGPAAGSGSGSEADSSPLGSLPLVGSGGGGGGLPLGNIGSILGGGGGAGPNGESSPASPSNDEGFLGLHLPANLLAHHNPASSGTVPGPHSHADPGAGSGHFPLDTAPVRQEAQTAIWHCDERGNMGASWQNPDGCELRPQSHPLPGSH